MKENESCYKSILRRKEALKAYRALAAAAKLNIENIK